VFTLFDYFNFETRFNSLHSHKGEVKYENLHVKYDEYDFCNVVFKNYTVKSSINISTI